MPKALSVDLRKRALALYDAGHKTAEVVRRLSVSAAWARRQKQRRREGRPLTPAVGVGRRPILDTPARLVLAGWVDATPDATPEELQDRLRREAGVSVSIGTVWNALRAGTFTLKKSR
jgi:transposase